MKIHCVHVFGDESNINVRLMRNPSFNDNIISQIL